MHILCRLRQQAWWICNFIHSFRLSFQRCCYFFNRSRSAFGNFHCLIEGFCKEFTARNHPFGDNHQSLTFSIISLVLLFIILKAFLASDTTKIPFSDCAIVASAIFMVYYICLYIRNYFIYFNSWDVFFWLSWFGVIVSALGLLAHAAVKINESVTANKSAHFHLLLNAIFIFLFIPFTN